MRRLLFCVGLLCVLTVAYGTADAHHPLGKVYFAYEFGAGEVPTLDGDLSDWAVVPESYALTTDLDFGQTAPLSFSLAEG